jgi:hypothetical protein
MAVADLPPRVETSFQEVRSHYELTGGDSQGLLSQFDGVMTQWRNRPSFSIEPESDADTINHVPFKNVGTIKVRFRKAKPMMPRVIDVEEVEAE